MRTPPGVGAFVPPTRGKREPTGTLPPEMRPVEGDSLRSASWQSGNALTRWTNPTVTNQDHHPAGGEFTCETEIGGRPQDL